MRLEFSKYILFERSFNFYSPNIRIIYERKSYCFTLIILIRQNAFGKAKNI